MNTQTASQQAAADRARAAQRSLSNLASFIRRPTTGWVRNRSAAWAYERAFRRVVVIEDADGIDAAAKYADRLTSLRHEAQRACLLQPEDIGPAERRAIAAADRYGS